MVAVLNKLVHVGQSALYIVSYLDRASRWLHKIVLPKLFNHYSGLPEHNLLSSRSQVKSSDKKSFAERIDASNKILQFH